MRSIFIILNNIFTVSGVAFQIVEEIKNFYAKGHYYRLIARMGNERLLAFVYYQGGDYLFLCENQAGFNKESQMPVAAVLSKYKGYRAYSRIRNLATLATKAGKYLNFTQMNGDDHFVKSQFFKNKQ